MITEPSRRHWVVLFESRSHAASELLSGVKVTGVKPLAPPGKVDTIEPFFRDWILMVPSLATDWYALSGEKLNVVVVRA